MKLLRPLPSKITGPLSMAVLAAWAATMAAVVNRSYLQASSTNLATDLARYGSEAQWHGVYYRGEKIGFTVSQTVPVADGYELQEDGRLQMSLLGATTPAVVKTTARVDHAFRLRSFEFSLDPGTGPIGVSGSITSLRLALSIKSGSGERTEVRELAEVPVLTQNVSRLLASGGLAPGARHQWTVFDPATLRNAPVNVEVGRRELVNVAGRPLPAFRVEMEFAGLRTSSWVTDTGEIVREESPMGLITIRETPERARAMAVGRARTDLLQAAAVVPITRQRIDEPRDVRRLRVRLDGADLSSPDLQGAGQSVDGDVVELIDPQRLRAGPADPQAAYYLKPEPLIESDAPEIRAEAEAAVQQTVGARARAERLTRYVNGLLEKKPTVSIPSAREVLRTKVGDCNEHTALFVAMARAAGIPARIDVGLVFVHGAFYYHAWPEVYIDDARGQGYWLPVDPTLNEFPADATHLRLARGGLDKQIAVLPLIGRLKMTVLDLELAPHAIPTLVGSDTGELGSLAIPLPERRSGGCWSSPARPARRPAR
jgi:transglutaminase-like putative cysteine protease